MSRKIARKAKKRKLVEPVMPSIDKFDDWLKENDPTLQAYMGTVNIYEIAARVLVIEKFCQWRKEQEAIASLALAR